MSDLRKALDNAVIFDRRDNLKHVVGRARETSRTIKAAARRFLALTETGLLAEFTEEWEYAHSEACTNMLTDDGECSKGSCHHEKPQSLRLLADYLTEEEE